MLRTGQSRCAPPRRRDLARRRGPRYRGPWRLPGPDSHRLAAVSLSLGYVVVPSFRCSSAPELLDAHSGGIGVAERTGTRLAKGAFEGASGEAELAGFAAPAGPQGLVAALVLLGGAGVER